MRIALGVEYDGTRYHGWQNQPELTTVQACVEKALTKVANENISIVCAGRTDAGVHATNQVIHFETNASRNLDAWIRGTNTYLPSSISIQWVKEVDETFHARFSALSRRYQYFIYNHSVRSALLSHLTTWVPHPLNEHSMNDAGQYLLGEHDFSSFRSAECQSRTPNRHLFKISVIRKKELVVIDIIANSFLHHMVRNIAGVLIEIGSNKKEVSWCQELLQVKNRTLATKTALPNGLFLTGVRYADNYELPCDFRTPIFNN